MPLSNYALDKFVAPNLSKLIKNSTLDLSKYIKPWILNFILNSIFGIHVDDKNRQYIINFLRRVDGTFYEYQNGSALLDEYLKNRYVSISKYYQAVLHFEQVIAQSYQAYMLGRG